MNSETRKASTPTIAAAPRLPTKEPRQNADDAAGRSRADQPPERRPQRAADNEHEDEDERIERIDTVEQTGVLPMRRLRLRQFLAVDDPDHPVDPGGNAAGEIAGLELRRDVLVDDALGGDVGQRAFEAIADLDAQAAVVLGDDEQRAVVDLLAADLPGFRDPQRILLDGLAVGRRHDQHRDLAAFSRLEILQRLRQRCDVAGD